MTSFDPRPPSAELLDELVSARLDGELDHAIHDLGLDPNEVEHWLATPEAQARAEAFGFVQTVVSAPVAPLDELSRRRLVAGALAADAGQTARTPTARRRSSVLGGLAVAASIAVVIAVAVHSSTTTGRTTTVAAGTTAPSIASSDKARTSASNGAPTVGSSESPTSQPGPQPRSLPDLGVVTSGADVAQRADAELGPNPVAPETAPSTDPTTSPTSDTTSAPSPPPSAPQPVTAAADPPCSDEVAALTGTPDAEIVATATLHGHHDEVVRARSGAHVEYWLVDPANCSVQLHTQAP